MNKAVPYLWMSVRGNRRLAGFGQARRLAQLEKRPGFSILEVMLVLTIIGVLLAMSAPNFQRVTEQAQADIAAANLRAVWTAQRFYWLENHQYAAAFPNLQNLLDPSVATSTTPYVYSILVIDNNTFTVTASRTGSTKWGGQLTIDQTGIVSGVIQANGEVNIVPGFQ